MKHPVPWLACVFLAGGTAADAATIPVINQGVQGAIEVVHANARLSSLGHSVATRGALTDYSAYDQIWNLRCQTNLNASGIPAFGAYLASGGLVFPIGGNPGGDATRGNALRTFLAAVRAGAVTHGSGTASISQTFTAAGAALNAPNLFSPVAFLGARQITGPGSGFLVTVGTGPDGLDRCLGFRPDRRERERNGEVIAMSSSQIKNKNLPIAGRNPARVAAAVAQVSCQADHEAVRVALRAAGQGIYNSVS